MAVTEQYIPGDYKVLCDRCGFEERVSKTAKTWDNLIVCYPKCWEPRNPQDYLRTKTDVIRVPEARPDPKTVTRETTLASDSAKGSNQIEVVDATYIAQGNSVGIVLATFNEEWDSTAEQTQWVLVTDVTGTTITFDPILWEKAETGQTVYLSQATGDTFQASGDVTPDSLP